MITLTVTAIITLITITAMDIPMGTITDLPIITAIMESLDKVMSGANTMGLANVIREAGTVDLANTMAEVGVLADMSEAGALADIADTKDNNAESMYHTTEANP